MFAVAAAAVKPKKQCRPVTITRQEMVTYEWIRDLCTLSPRQLPWTTTVFIRPGDGINHCKPDNAIDVDALVKTTLAGLSQQAKKSAFIINQKEAVEVLSRAAALRTTYNPDYDALASRVLAMDFRSLTPGTFRKSMVAMALHIHAGTGKAAPLINKELVTFALNGDNKVWRRIEAALVSWRDHLIPYAGMVKLRHAYLTVSSQGELLETPQYMWMRVSLGIHGVDHIDDVLATYEMSSTLVATHATPTLINAGRPKAQMASCFLGTVAEDSIDGIYGTLHHCAMVSARGGGLGVSFSHVRADKSYVAGSNGESNGLVAWHRQYDLMVQEVDQGGGKRKGACASYLEPTHADFPDWLDLKLQHGDETRRARHLFYGVWMPDLLMKRAHDNADWSMFCPNEAPGLSDIWGEAYEKQYKAYEDAGKARSTVSACALLRTICDRQIETGGPYMMYKDACNRKSNQQHLGTIRGSNLCTEIVEFASAEEMAVCNLASIALPKFIRRTWSKEHGLGDVKSMTPGKTVAGEFTQPWFDHAGLGKVVHQLVRNLNRVIDRNYYPVPEAKHSNLKHRPIGLGVQGFADTLAEMGLAWQDPEARVLNRQIFETIYYEALWASCELATERGRPHASWQGSPASKGYLQMDLWEQEARLPKAWKGKVPLSTQRHDWPTLRKYIAKHGLLNSLLVAPMPTVSTSKILGNSPGIEPYHGHVLVERALSGDTVYVTHGFVRRMMKRGLWTEAARLQVLEQEGLLGQCSLVPDDLKRLYATGWEIKLRTQIDMVADRAPFVDQSQSFNVWLSGSQANTMAENLMQFHMYTWRRGLKTSSYYVRTKVRFGGQKFALEAEKIALAARSGSSKSSSSGSDEEEVPTLTCNLRVGEPEECESCGS